MIRAAIELCDVVITDRVRLGERDNEVCMALVRLPGCAVRLCAAFLGELSSDREAAHALAAELLEGLGKSNGYAAVMEFRPNPSRAAQRVTVPGGPRLRNLAGHHDRTR